ncbi:MAG: sulfatase-like hydrolase/transferase [Terriglobales bacterium]
MLQRTIKRLLFVIFALVLPSALCFADGNPNIVLVTLDSTRADRMGFLGSSGHLTPHLDGLAHEGVIFGEAYAQAPLTVASEATILTGTYPQTHHASELGVPLAEGIPYLPDLLHAHGYRTAAFVGSLLLDPQNGPFQGFDRGFDVYDAGFHQPQRGENRYHSVERDGDQVVARAIKWLADHKQQPFFLWVHLYDAHAPYSSYNRAITTTDVAVGRLLSFLRAQKLYDGALVVVASNHGESLGAHGEETHGIFLYDETVHVPLVLKLPKNQMAGKRVNNRARLLDVAPTLLEAAGVPVPSQMQGQSLLRIAQTSSQADPPAYARSDLPNQGFGCSPLESWRAGKYLYIRSPKPELYDLTADPTATRNLAQSSKATLETLASQLQSFDRHFGKDAGNSAGPALTSSEMQKLASLGYVGLQKSGGNVSAAVEGTDPKDVIAIVNQTLAALLDVEDGKPEKAVPIFHHVLGIQPNTYLAQYGMGAALAQQQQYAEAIGYLRKAIALQPDSAWAHYQMGFSLMKTGDFKTAAVHLEIASGRLPACAALHSALADAYAKLGRGDEASRERTRASHLSPKS